MFVRARIRVHTGRKDASQSRTKARASARGDGSAYDIGLPRDHLFEKKP